MVHIMEAARYFVYLSYEKERYSLTSLKLQKILYLAQGWSYVWDNKPAFPESFCAWQYGPVNEEVYAEFKKYGRSEIPKEEGIGQLGDLDVAETLEAVWMEFGRMTAFNLVELTHEQTPWKYAYANDLPISNEQIREYFQATF